MPGYTSYTMAKKNLAERFMTQTVTRHMFFHLEINMVTLNYKFFFFKKTVFYMETVKRLIS